MKIGIFGGSFNPPHNMHTDIANYMINRHYVDKVVFVPTGSKYTYKNNLIEEEHRYNMLEILSNKNDNIMVSDYELKSEVVYTIDTLKHFKEEYPNDEICFICGLDNFSYIDKWKNGEEILTNYKIVVINRDGNDLEELLVKYDKYKDNIIISNMEMKDISSTYIRDNIKEIDKVKEYIDEDVLRYIQENNLYR
jgi:nicotinate-nucleotide adenylyltransferase